jgi:predicted nucleotidyltransferase
MTDSPLGSRHLEQLLRDVCDTLDEAGVEYAIIGGIALSIWGEPRTTFDVDLVVAIRPDEIESLCETLTASHRFLIDPSVCPMPRMTLVRVHQVDHDKTPSELLLADLLVHEDDTASHVIARRRKGTFLGRDYWFCSPEDLIVLKLVAGRRRDKTDVLAVLSQMSDELDVEYIEQRAATVGKSDEWEVLVSEWKTQ